MAGLDPSIDEVVRPVLAACVDPRVKPGDDGVAGIALNAKQNTDVARLDRATHAFTCAGGRMGPPVKPGDVKKEKE